MSPTPPGPPPSAHEARRLTRSRLAIGILVMGVLAVSVAALFVTWGGHLRPPPPDLTPRAGPGPALAQPAPSELSVPVHYDLAPLIDLLEALVPERFGDLSEERVHPATGIRFALEARREPLRVELSADTVRMSAVIHYQGRGRIENPWFPAIGGSCAGSDEERPRALLTIATPLELGPDWTLRTGARLERLEPLTSSRRDRCLVTELELDLTELVMEAARSELAGLAEQIDAFALELDLRTPLEEYWDLVSRPVPLGEAPVDGPWAGKAWLLLEPLAVRSARLVGPGRDEGSARIEVGVTARPRLVLGERPPTGVRPLPPLSDAELPEGFRVTLEGRADYGMLSEMATEQLRGQEFQAVGRQIRVRRARLSGLGDGRIAMALEVEGGLRGRVFLVGTPTLDPESGEVVVRDLDFHVETRNLLVRAAAWVLRAGFPEHVRRHARWPIEETLNWSRSVAHQGLNRRLSPEARLEGGLGSLELTEVAATRDALVVRSVLSGHARVIVEPE